jgi:hypothetical protein
MIKYKCPSCKKDSYEYEKLVMKVCFACQVEMEVLE